MKEYHGITPDLLRAAGMSDDMIQYYREGIEDPDYDNHYVDTGHLITETEESFSCGQSYEDTPAKVLKCGVCGGLDFNVATGSYWTGIRCVKCRYELCIHSG